MQEISVLITIHSEAYRDDQASEPVTLITSGRLFLEEDKARLEYEESLDESLPSQQVTIRVADDTMQMTRDGEYATDLVFQKGARYEGSYQTPYGEMALAVFCTRLRYDLNARDGEILLSYQMDINGQFAAMHEMEIRVIAQDE